MYANALEFAKELAREASALARSRQASLATQEKPNRSFVTDLDLDLERLIRARISEAFPDDGLTGEELEAGGGAGSRRWCIDPIDGTGNLVHGFPLWSISIGMIDGDIPAVGVIAVPLLGELFWASLDQGAWRDGTRIHAVDAERFHEHDNVSVSTNALRSLDPRTIPGRIRDIGSACCELAFVACGRVRASIFLGEQTHDLAAGAVIACEAGCRFARLGGPALSPGEFVLNAPVTSATFIAPPGRLGAMQAQVRGRVGKTQS
jgi:myo-inositol-1(or 4)-monophosphatase